MEQMYEKLIYDRSTTIIIYNNNTIEQVKACVESIRVFTDVCYEIIIVDDCSIQTDEKWLEESKGLKVLSNDEKLGFVKSINKAITVSDKASDIMLLDCNTIATPNWLTNMRIALYSEKAIGAVDAISNNGGFNSFNKEVTFDNLEDMIQYSKKNNRSNKAMWNQRVNLCKYFMLIKREAFDETGFFDEGFKDEILEDEDYCYRLVLNGYKLLTCKDVFLYRNGEKSTYPVIQFKENAFYKKWGFEAVYSNAVRMDLVALIDSDLDKAINVLEVGCACGGTLLEIRNRYKYANIFGIELDSGAAKIASKVAQVNNYNIEAEDLGYKEDFFDYIIFGDVLEHLNNPWKVLEDMKKHLKVDGAIIASVPNIMHFSILQELLSGNWNYRDFGILDKTHLRFFTYNTICAMFKNAGYQKIDADANVKRDDGSFVAQLDNLVPQNKKIELEIYQYLIRARRQG